MTLPLRQGDVRLRFGVPLLHRLLHARLQRLGGALPDEDLVALLDEIVQQQDEHEGTEVHLLQVFVEVLPRDPEVQPQEIFQALLLPRQTLQVLVGHRLLQAPEYVLPGHDEAEAVTSHGRPVSLLTVVLRHEMAVVALHVVHHHARPAGQNCGHFDPANLVLRDQARAVPPHVVVAQGHGDAAVDLSEEVALALPADGYLASAADHVGRVPCPAVLHVLGATEHSRIGYTPVYEAVEPLPLPVVRAKLRRARERPEVLPVAGSVPFQEGAQVEILFKAASVGEAMCVVEGVISDELDVPGFRRKPRPFGQIRPARGTDLHLRTNKAHESLDFAVGRHTHERREGPPVH